MLLLIDMHMEGGAWYQSELELCKNFLEWMADEFSGVTIKVVSEMEECSENVYHVIGEQHERA